MSPGANTWNAIRDIRQAIKSGDLDRAMDHSDTLRAISREDPLLYDYSLGTPLELARTLKSAGRLRQALMVLAEYPLPENSGLHDKVSQLREEILTHLRSHHPDAPTPASPSPAPEP